MRAVGTWIVALFLTLPAIASPPAAVTPPVPRVMPHADSVDTPRAGPNVPLLTFPLPMPLVLPDLFHTNPPTPPIAAPPSAEDVAERLSATVLTVTVPDGTGTGIPVILNADGSAWVWTAAHVVSSLRHEIKLTPIGGPDNMKPHTIVTYAPCMVGRFHVEKADQVRWVEWTADVVRVDYRHDLALLRIREAKPAGLTSAAFWPADKPPLRIGAPVLCAGSAHGKDGHGTTNVGAQSYIGRRWRGLVWDQASAASQPGHSGGAVACAKTGLVIGIVQGGPGETYTRYVPSRRIHEWANEAGVAFALDPTSPAPSVDTLRKLPIEEVRSED